LRILILDEHYRIPPLDGGARSTWDLHRSLTELGHEAVVTGDDSLLENHQWDVVMASRPVLAARVAERASRAAQSHTVYLGHDLHHRRLAAPDGVLPDHPRPVAVVSALERRCWLTYDISIYPNHGEVAEASAAGATARWFPYFRIDGAFEERPQPAPPIDPETPPLLLFVGGSTHAPNVNGLRWFTKAVLPEIPHAQIVVVGRWEPVLQEPLADAGLRFTGPLSDNELGALRARASANIAPLTAGAGLKSKVVEALASGAVLIATSVAMEGIPEPWLMALPGDDADQWRAALSALGKPSVTAPLIAHAAGYVRARHGTTAYLSAVQGLLEEPLQIHASKGSQPIDTPPPAFPPMAP